MKRRLGLLSMVVLGVALTRITQAEQSNPTAFSLINKGDKYVGIQSKDKIVEIVSDKSAGSLAPNVWHVVYYDPDTPMKRVEVKFGGDQEMDVSHPLRPFEMPPHVGDTFDRSKLKVDSDRALNIAAAQPLLKPLKLKSSKLTLSQSDAGPEWKVQLWAEKLNDPAREADVGTVTLSATDGTVLKADLHPGRAD